jgi:hypothetical protein
VLSIKFGEMVVGLEPIGVWDFLNFASLLELIVNPSIIQYIPWL